MVKATVKDLEGYLLAVKEAPHEKIPAVDELFGKLVSVDYQQRLSILKRHNLLGTILIKIAGGGHTAHIKCIIQSIEPNDRFGVYKLTDDGSCTLIHHAAYHGHHEVIEIVLASLCPAERAQLLSFVDVSGMTALDYAAHKGSNVDRAVSVALLRQLTMEQKKELLDGSQVFQRAADEKDIDSLLSDQPLMDINQRDEAVPAGDVIGSQPLAFKQHAADPVEELRRENQRLTTVVEQQGEQLASVIKEFTIFKRIMADPENGALVRLHQGVQESQNLKSQVKELQSFKTETEAQNLENKVVELQGTVDNLKSTLDEEFAQEPENDTEVDPQELRSGKEMAKKIRRIEDCMQTLCQSVQDLQLRCKYVKTGVPESLQRNPSVDDTTTQAEEQCCCSRSSSMSSGMSDPGSIDENSLLRVTALPSNQPSTSGVEDPGSAGALTKNTKEK